MFDDEPPDYPWKRGWIAECVYRLTRLDWQNGRQRVLIILGGVGLFLILNLALLELSHIRADRMKESGQVTDQ